MRSSSLKMRAQSLLRGMIEVSLVLVVKGCFHVVCAVMLVPRMDEACHGSVELYVGDLMFAAVPHSLVSFWPSTPGFHSLVC